jgi:starch synthase (maltosyl-transferring)
VHPELGTLDDVRSLITAAQAQGIEVALDIAFQCSPDHPWVKEHPDWFRARPDGTIQYAENPPKKYQDIYPIDFESTDWRNLWEALTDVFRTWNRLGVRIFRVDNPHTKAFPFWEHCIAEIQAEDPGAIFLAEAFTRPKVMYRLAKLGFTQSYTYFAWRTGKAELVEYFTELTQGPPASFFRPNLWPNTPDILTEQLQTGGRPMFLQRLVLAATLGASYGIYGPAFELMEHTPREHGSEEYLDSEKYQIRAWELDDPRSLRYSIAEINGIRRANLALQTDRGLRFHAIDNDELLCYSKVSYDGRNVVLVVVNLDPRWRQSGWTDLSLAELGLSEGESFHVRDLLTGETYAWSGRRNYVELDPAEMPAHIFLVQREARPTTSRRTVVTGPLA